MKKQVKIFALIIASIIGVSSFANAEDASVIDAKADVAIEMFKKRPGGEKFLSEVHGYLIFPSVLKGGFVVGGEYGEGALRINGTTVGYYSIASGSFGFQLGAQKSSYLIAFADQKVLDKFRRSNGWEAGVDGAITAVKWGAGKDISSISFENPIYAIVFNAKGLMGSLSLEGTKFTPIHPGKTNVYDDIQKYTK